MPHAQDRAFLRVRYVIALATLSVGCVDPVSSPALSRNSNSVEELLSEQVRKGQPDRDFIRLARTAPGFAGMFYDNDGRLTVALSQTERTELIVSAAEALLAEWGEPGHIETTRVVNYDFAQLSEWSDRFLQVYRKLGANFLDVDEARNRVVVGMVSIDGDAQTRFARAIDSLGIPAAAIVLEQRGPYREVATLQDRVRPALGGFQLHVPVPVLDITHLCSLGPIVGKVEEVGALFFVTAHHCTRTRTSVDGDSAFQNTVALNNKLGYEVVDPAGYVNADNSDCPVGDYCRKSDASLFQFYNPSDGSRGKIAHTMYSGSASGSITLNGPGISIFGGTKSFLQNQTHQKMGRTTGWTYGPLASVCHVWTLDPSITYTCQMTATMGVDAGDSGGPVFRYDTYGRALLTGIVKARSLAGEAVFSPITGITSELGPLIVVP